MRFLQRKNLLFKEKDKKRQFAAALELFAPPGRTVNAAIPWGPFRLHSINGARGGSMSTKA